MKRKLIALTMMVTLLVSMFTTTYAFNDGDLFDEIPDYIKNITKIDQEIAATLEDLEKELKVFDEDMDKVFENLEAYMEFALSFERIPCIIVFNKDVTEFSNELDILSGLTVKHEFNSINGKAMDLTKSEIEMLSKLDIVSHIEYDSEMHLFMDTSSYWYGADKAASDFNVDGNTDGLSSYSKDDMVVAVIDTGIDKNHVDLDGSKVIAWKDYVNNQSSPYDDHGHGTHCAGIVAAEGDGNSNYKGVASGAALVGLKVLASNGSGSTSNVDAAIQWCIDNKDTYGIDIISMSLGSTGSSDGTDSTSLLCNQATDAGIVVLVAAGNSGPSRYTIGSPGAAEKVITVGNMSDPGEKGFHLSYLSSRGPTADNRIKPDIGAPGVAIMAPKANSTNGYVAYSGTSMATPFTAGTVALMLEANPSLTPAQIKTMLISTAEDWGPNGKDEDYGYGRLDAYEAVKTAGGLSGSNIATPDHYYASEDIAMSKGSDYWSFNVTDTTYPIAITLIMPGWAGGWFSGLDLDVYLHDENGNTLAKSEGTGRQETINYMPTNTGTYTIRVYSYRDTGNYFFDLSVGGNSLTLTQDN